MGAKANLDLVVSGVDAHSATGDGTDGGRQQTGDLLFIQASGNGLGPVHVHLNYRLCPAEVTLNRLRTGDTGHGLNECVAGLLELLAGGRLDGDVHRVGHAETATLRSKGDGTGVLDTVNSSEDGVL